MEIGTGDFVFLSLHARGDNVIIIDKCNESTNGSKALLGKAIKILKTPSSCSSSPSLHFGLYAFSILCLGILRKNYLYQKDKK